MTALGYSLLWCCVFFASQDEKDKVLFDFDRDFDLLEVEARDVVLSHSEGGDALRLASGHQARWPGITLEAPEGRFDLTPYRQVMMDVCNTGPNAVKVCLRVDNPGADGKKDCVTGSILLEPGAAGTLSVPLKRFPEGCEAVELFGMRGMPAQADPFSRIDPSNVTQLIIYVPEPAKDHLFEVASIRATGRYRPLPTDQGPSGGKSFFPFIDTFGQYIHGDWPGKTRSVGDLEKHREEEARDLARHPGPSGWNQYGGFEQGPKLEATDRFRVEKYGGRWWLVDPEGRLFWSHGMDCVHASCGKTPITDRRHWFQDLPDPGTPLHRFVGEDRWAPHGYYKGRIFETYDQSAANLLRKYGPDWKAVFAETTHRRLRSFGMNTIGNWSDEDIRLQGKTPYVVAVHYAGPDIEGSEGYWGKFPDAFHPGFEKVLKERLAREAGKTAGDPWCLGYFVDNELSFGDEFSLAEATLRSPPEQPAKQAFVADLKEKYGTVEALNRSWGTRYASFDTLLANRAAPDRERAGLDLEAFYTRLVERYFETCRDAVKEAAPNHLYLGCRFAWANPRAVQAAAKYCDVISYNLYRREVESFRLPSAIDRPVIIGEFHFGALDRGLFHTGLQAVDSQEDRARAYASYVEGALRNPLVVGTHWFQYMDQATTGRGDGENYQIGFLDVVDTPYAEIIRACRRVGYGLYEYRSKGGEKRSGKE